MKLTVVAPDRLEEIVPEISKYSNTQNKVTLVDFSSNHPYHVAVEKVTRSLWAPLRTAAARRPAGSTRGQVASTPTRSPGNGPRPPEGVQGPPSAVTEVHQVRPREVRALLGSAAPHREPRRREELPRVYDQTWARSTYVDATYCRASDRQGHPVQGTEKIVTAQGFRASEPTSSPTRSPGSPRHRTADRPRPDLAGAEADPGLAAAIDDLSRRVRTVIASPSATPTSPSGPRRRMLEQGPRHRVDVPDQLRAELVDPSAITARGRHAAETRSQADAQRIIVVASIPAETWLVLARWAKETQSLEPWQRRRASEFGRCLSDGQGISVEQATDGERIMTEARRLGFRP